jgi:hypothetical protein
MRNDIDKLLSEPADSVHDLSVLSDEQLNVKLAKRMGWKLADGKWWHDDIGDGPPMDYCRTFNRKFAEEILKGLLFSHRSGSTAERVSLPKSASVSAADIPTPVQAIQNALREGDFDFFKTPEFREWVEMLSPSVSAAEGKTEEEWKVTVFDGSWYITTGREGQIDHLFDSYDAARRICEAHNATFLRKSAPSGTDTERLRED